MKILMISPQFRPLVGGYERAAERLSIGLAKRGHQVAVFSERRNREWLRDEMVDGVRIQRWWCIYSRGWHSVTSLLGLCCLLLRCGRHFDVWHVHHHGRIASLTIVLGLLLNRPMVLKLVSTRGQGLPQSGLGRVGAAVHRRASRVVVLSREMWSEAAAFGFRPTQIVLIPNGIDTSAYRPEVRAELDRSETTGLALSQRVISVGRLSPEKNLPLLLAAWARAERRLSGVWNLEIVGDGPDRPLLEDQVDSRGLGRSVSFAGYLQEVHDRLRGAALFVQSSNNEGLSNTMLEALATGLPVVCTDVSGAHECVREPQTGLVVPVGDSTALADAIVELANDPAKRTEMSKRAVALIRNRYSIEHVAELHEQLYQSLIGDRRTGKGP